MATIPTAPTTNVGITALSASRSPFMLRAEFIPRCVVEDLTDLGRSCLVARFLDLDQDLSRQPLSVCGENSITNFTLCRCTSTRRAAC